MVRSMSGISSWPASSGCRSTNACDRFRRGGFADGIGDVNGEKVGGVEKAVHGFEADMVGVHVPGFFPAEFADGLVRRGAHAGGFGADDGVLAVGFVPDGSDFDALLRRQDAGLQLGLGLMRKTVAHAKGKFPS